MPTRLFAALFATLFTASLPIAHGQSPAVSKALDSWRSRQKKHATVEYVITGVVEHMAVDPSDIAYKLPPAERVQPYRAKITLDLRHQRYRIDSDFSVLSAATGKFEPRAKQSAYNGKSFQERVPRDVNRQGADDPDLGIITGHLGRVSIEMHLWPVLYAHGFVPTADRPARPDLSLDRVADEFAAAARMTLRSESCDVLRTLPDNTVSPISDEFWVSPRMSGAVLRHVYFNGKNPWVRNDVNYHNDATQGWPLADWTSTWTVNGQTQRLHRLKVESFTPDVLVPDEMFIFAVEPGMVVAEENRPQPGSGLDPNRPEFRKYRAGVVGNTTLETREQVTFDGEPRPAAGWPWWMIALGGAFAAILVTVGVVFFLRRRSRSKG